MPKAYKKSGVDIQAGYEVVERITSHVERTSRKEVLGGLDGSGAIFNLSQLKMKTPVLVSGTDGVGTKLKLAIDYGEHDTTGIDTVTMRVNDILTIGAEPLYFSNHIVMNKVVLSTIKQIVKGISDDCEQINTALIGGETAGMGEMYHEGGYDTTGFVVRTVEKEDYIDGSNVEEGQAIIGLAPSGIHSNDYSLIRKMIKESGVQLHDQFNDQTFLKTFLVPTKLYAKPVLELKKHIDIKTMGHITGGGSYESILCAFPKGLSTKIDTQSFPTLEVFNWFQKQGNISTGEVYNIFNMGIGYTATVDKKDVQTILTTLCTVDTTAYETGEIIKDDDTPIHLLEVE